MSLRIACQGFPAISVRFRFDRGWTALWTALLLLAGCGDAPETVRTAWSRLDPLSEAIWAEAVKAGPDPVGALRSQAQALAESLRRGSDAERWERERQELRRVVQALAYAPQAHELPWAEWIQADLRLLPEWSAHTMAAAGAALGPDALPIARSWDRREVPDALRLEAHLLLWLEDPGEAGPRARALLFREDPRAQDRLRAAYLETVLPFAPADEATEILLRAAAYDGMEHRARLLAIRALLERRTSEAAPIFESIFLAERSNFVLRREAFQALLELDRARGRDLLARRHPDEQADPGFGAWLDELRAQEGVRAG